MLLIFLSKNSSRCEYVFELIFKHEFRVKYSVTTDIKVFQAHPGEKINYSDFKKGGDFFIKASSFLFETEIKKQEIKVEEKDHTKFLFPNTDCDLGFDIFSAVFYMVSRYEEYLPFTSDQFGRYKASDSLAFQNNFLQKPIVNIWINVFKNTLQQKYPLLKIQSSVFNAILTYDIDVAYKYRGRNLTRTIGSVFKDLLTFKIKDILIRKKTLLKIQKDPWDVYDDLEKTILQNESNSIFFFLLADKGEHDRNLDYKNPLIKELIHKVESFSEIGIHPSFTTSSFPEKILIEKGRLENLSGRKITKSRQHYLKFTLPDTYNSLLAAGITEDYSMGFPQMPGFRAGTCKPFYFYDLKNEKETDLKLFPITFMEGSLMNSQRDTNESIQQILNLIKEVKNVRGTFISLWHNHTISKTDEYIDWKNIHDKMVQYIIANGA